MPKPPKPSDRPASPRYKGKARSSKERDLRDLMREVPEGEELTNILYGLGASGHTSAAIDRTAAIVGVTFLEYGLKKAISTHFRSGLSEGEIESLFDGNADGPLATFHARTRLAYALGILSAREANNFDIIRRIRNAFAHSMRHFEFSTDEVDRECASLWIGGVMTEYSLRDAPPKVRYTTAVSLHYLHLMWYAPGKQWPPPSWRGILSGQSVPSSGTVDQTP